MNEKPEKKGKPGDIIYIRKTPASYTNKELESMIEGYNQACDDWELYFMWYKNERSVVERDYLVEIRDLKSKLNNLPIAKAIHKRLGGK